MPYTVYMHRNKINNKVYIGITSQSCHDRWRRAGEGYKQQPKFYNAIQKYGWDNFEHIILFTNLTAVEADEKEISLIALYNSIENGYNIKKGGHSYQHNDITKEKLKTIMSGKKHTEEAKQKMREHTTKIPVKCVETNQKYESIRAASTATNIDASSISRCCKGQQLTAGKYHWEYLNQTNKIILKNDQRFQPVLCITTGKKYISLAAASRDTGADVSNIRKVCEGKYKTTKKLKWKYITLDEYQN